MKKWLVSMALIVCVLSFTACGSSQETAVSSFTPEEEQNWLDSGLAFVQSMDQALETQGIDAYAEDELLGPALEAYASSKEEMGQINGFEAVSVTEDEKDVVITVNIDGTDHDGEVIITVTEEKGEYNISGITTNTIYSFKELMTQAGLNTLMGMGITFTVLGLLILIISLFKFIPLIQSRMEENRRKKAEAEAARNAVPAAAPAPAAPAAEEEEFADDMELVAVIAAAIAAYEGQATADGFVVRSIRKSRKKSA